ncbi:uracil-DNA glycosylase family protein, partial [Ottowia sp.]|uniref:uracil-DNA glycosylase family protein n=1 Tax=Ottowia sp. TaxID=1898956 RepID=UPI0039E27595
MGGSAACEAAERGGHILDERQRAMLAEMGIRLWAPRAPAAPETIAAGARQTSAGAPKHAQAPAARTAPPPAVPAPVPTPAPAATALGPRPEGVEAMDWPALEAAVAGCRACALCAGRTRTVFGVGSRRADWMVVGEAPGENEDRQGQPFVGQAG